MVLLRKVLVDAFKHGRAGRILHFAGPMEDRSGCRSDTQRCRVPTRHLWGQRQSCLSSTATKTPLEDDGAARMLSWSGRGVLACAPVRLPQTVPPQKHRMGEGKSRQFLAWLAALLFVSLASSLKRSSDEWVHRQNVMAITSSNLRL